MKKSNLILFLLMALPTLLLTSCLKDQDDIFDDSASARVDKYLARAKKVLTSSERGWILNYYPDRDQSYGGYVFTLKFNDQTVEVGTEIADDITETIESTYVMNNEAGPVISFDTYNAFMHYFATPSGSSGAGGYEAYDGDFIFIIMDISEDENTITLKGNRSGNIMYMHRLEGDRTEYLETVAEVETLMKSNEYGLRIGDTEVTVMKTNRRFTFTAEENGDIVSVSAPYIVTPEGFELYKPVTILGHEISGFKVSEGDEFEEMNNPDIVLYKVIFYMSKEDFLGTFLFEYESYFGGNDGGVVTIAENPAEENGIVISDMFISGLKLYGYYDMDKNQIYIYDMQDGIRYSSYYGIFMNFDDADIAINVRSDGTMVTEDMFGIDLFTDANYTNEAGWYDISVYAVFTKTGAKAPSRTYKTATSEWQPKVAEGLKLVKKLN